MGTYKAAEETTRGKGAYQVVGRLPAPFHAAPVPPPQAAPRAVLVQKIKLFNADGQEAQHFDAPFRVHIEDGVLVAARTS